MGNTKSFLSAKEKEYKRKLGVNIHDLIKKVVKERNIKMTVFAQEYGFSKSKLDRFRKGDYTIDSLVRISFATGIDLGELLSIAPDKKPKVSNNDAIMVSFEVSGENRDKFLDFIKSEKIITRF